MQLRNTAEAYGSIAKWFHWLTAGLFLASYCTIYYRHWFAEDDLENWAAIQLHFTAGVSVGVIVILRVIWRLLNQQPALEATSGTRNTVAKISHYSLYAVTLLMPITGYLSLADYFSSGRGSITYLLLFDITLLKNLQVPEFLGIHFNQLEDPADFIHSILGAWLVWLLILGHALAAIYHHFILNDMTLSKMTFQKVNNRFKSGVHHD